MCDLVQHEHALQEVQESHKVELREQDELFNAQLEEAKATTIAELNKRVLEVSGSNHVESLFLMSWKAEQDYQKKLEEKDQEQEEALSSIHEQLDVLEARLAGEEEAQRLLQIEADREKVHRERTEEALQASELQKAELDTELQARDRQVEEFEEHLHSKHNDQQALERDLRLEIESLRKRLNQAQDDLARAEEGATGQVDVLDRHTRRIEELEEDLREARSSAEESRRQHADEIQVIENQSQDEVRDLRRQSQEQQQQHAETSRLLHDEIERLKTLVGKLRMQSSDADGKPLNTNDIAHAHFLLAVVRYSKLQKTRHALQADYDSKLFR